MDNFVLNLDKSSTKKVFVKRETTFAQFTQSAQSEIGTAEDVVAQAPPQSDKRAGASDLPTSARRA